MTRPVNTCCRANAAVVVLLLTLLRSPGVDALQCIDPPMFVTSDVAVQVYELSGSALEPLPAARVQVLHGTTDRGDPITSGTTDDHGFVQLRGVAAGKYLLMIDHDRLHPYLGSLHVTGSRGKARVLGAQLDESCPLSCVVDSGAHAEAAARSCLNRRLRGEDEAVQLTAGLPRP